MNPRLNPGPMKLPKRFRIETGTRETVSNPRPVLIAQVWSRPGRIRDHTYCVQQRAFQIAPNPWWSDFEGFQTWWGANQDACVLVAIFNFLIFLKGTQRAVSTRKRRWKLYLDLRIECCMSHTEHTQEQEIFFHTAVASTFNIRFHVCVCVFCAAIQSFLI